MSVGCGPLCVACRHEHEFVRARGQSGYRCTVYPEGIPEEITGYGHDHRKPYPGDGGVMFEKRTDVEESVIERFLEMADDLFERVAASKAGDPRRPVYSQVCVYCRHYRLELHRDGFDACDAFLGGIPEAIWKARNSHREAYPGDHGIRFEKVSVQELNARAKAMSKRKLL